MGRLYKNTFKAPTNTKEHVFEKQKQYYKGMAQQKHETKIRHKNYNIQNAKEGIIIAMWSVKERYNNNSAKRKRKAR